MRGQDQRQHTRRGKKEREGEGRERKAEREKRVEKRKERLNKYLEIQKKCTGLLKHHTKIASEMSGVAVHSSAFILGCFQQK